MANRKATFAKRQRETDLKDRAKAKEARRAQKRNEVSTTKGPQISWDDAVHAVTSDELPPLTMANQQRDGAPGDLDGDTVDPDAVSAAPPASPDPARPQGAS